MSEVKVCRYNWVISWPECRIWCKEVTEVQSTVQNYVTELTSSAENLGHLWKKVPCGEWECNIIVL